MDAENVLPDGVLSSTHQLAKPQDSFRPFTSAKKGLGASATARPTTSARTKRRALGDITNRHSSASNNTTATLNKAGNKVGISKMKRSGTPTIKVRRDSRIPVDENGNVLSPEYLPPKRALPPFEPPVFDFDDNLFESTRRDDRVDPFNRFVVQVDSPFQTLLQSPVPCNPELMDSSIEPPFSVFKDSPEVNVDALFNDEDLPTLQLS